MKTDVEKTVLFWYKVTVFEINEKKIIFFFQKILRQFFEP